MPLKAYQLVEKTRAELLEELATLEKKLFELRGQIATSASAQKHSEIKNTRKDVARVKTILMEQQRKALLGKYEGAKHVPKDLRAKTTKSQRKQLAAKYANKLVKKAASRAKFLKPTRFALKA